MTEATEQITTLEAEIFKLADQADVFDRYLRRQCDESQRETIEQIIEFLDQRIGVARAELKRLEGFDIAVRLSKQRDRKYPPIIKRRPVRFYGISEVNDARNQNYTPTPRNGGTTLDRYDHHARAGR